MSIYAEQVFGIPLSLTRNQNAPQILRNAADRLEKRIEAIKTIGTMENFWSAPIEWIKNGELTKEPFDPSLGIPYQSVAPIRVIGDLNIPVLPDPIEPLLKKAFIVYCDNVKKNGLYTLPQFNSKIDKLKFNVRHVLTRLGII